MLRLNRMSSDESESQSMPSDEYPRAGIFPPPAFRMPDFYRPGPKPGLDLPLYWKDDLTGILKRAIAAYINNRVGEGPEPTPGQFRLLVDYLRYYINAPAWTLTAKDAFDDELGALRARGPELKTPDEV